jgi:hypothetical protein
MSNSQESGGIRIEFDNVPVWAKIVVFLGLGMTITFGFMSGVTETLVYNYSPSVPVSATKQIYPVHIMRGSLRYVKREDMEQLAFWEDHLKYGMIGLVAAILVLFPYRTRQ